MRRILQILLFFLGASNLWGGDSKKWIVYYSDVANDEALSEYALLVFDSDFHPPLEPFLENGQTVLGYISLGEAEKERHFFEEVKEEGILLEENENWPGSYFVDLRDPRWAKRVIEQLIPTILFQRFDGIFLDTLDNAEFLDAKKPGMKQAAINLVKAIRLNFPQIKIMMNRGYQILPEVAPFLDMELGESVFTGYDFKEKKAFYNSSELYQQQVDLLKAGLKRNPKLKIYTLDYWDPKDSKGIKKIYQEQRKNGFHPYVSTIDLHKVIPEPQ